MSLKVEAVVRVREGELPVARIAVDLDISKDTLYTWVRKADQQGLSTDQVSESERNRALMKENTQLKIEVELLKKRARTSRKRVVGAGALFMTEQIDKNHK